jgi:hypothetical protein
MAERVALGRPDQPQRHQRRHEPTQHRSHPGVPADLSEPERAKPADDDDVPRAARGAVRVPAGRRILGDYRFQSGFPYAPIVPDGAVGLNVCNFGCPFFETKLDQNRSESVNVMNFWIDKSIGLGRAKASVMLDIYNVLNADPVTNFNLNDAAGYKTVIAVLDPRVLQVGFRLEF